MSALPTPTGLPAVPPVHLQLAPPVTEEGASEWKVRARSVYLVGIGGCGMSGLARMLRARGALVSGSDQHAGEATDALVREGIRVGFDQASGDLPEGTHLVVASAAIKPDHPQLLRAQERGIEVMTYAEALGQCMLGRTAVCVAGTHGKSTTTSMLSCVLSDAGLDPTSIVGATCAQLGGAEGLHGGGFRLGAPTIPDGRLAGAPGLLLAESCEFNRSFHHYHPTLAVITSVEADHLDIYGSLDAVVESFRVFAGRVAPASRGGLLLIGHDGAHRREVTAGVTCDVRTIGFSPEADWVVTHEAESRRTTLRGPGLTGVLEWINRMPGAHNAMNSATAAALALSVGADPARIVASLSRFAGVDRRMQLLGERPHPLGGVVRVFDDYGHHPTEVECTLKALRAAELGGRAGRLVCVFQPHQHSRTRHLLGEFASAFSAADMVIVPDIYFVRDSQIERAKVSARDLVDRLREKGVTAMHMHPFEAIVEQLGHLTRPGDVLLVMGAGPVYQVGRGFLNSAGPSVRVG